MSEETSHPADEAVFDRRLAFLLAMAMFVLVVDTSLMNVSISSVVNDLGTTVSGVQAAIALEALVSAAFILIGSKIGDLIGRKRAYVLGLLAYAVGAAGDDARPGRDARSSCSGPSIGGLGASLLLPAMQSLIHGNFEGAAQKKVYALVGASAAIAAAIGPLLGGFITTYLSWRVGFLLEVVVIGVVLSGIARVRDVAYTAPARSTSAGAVLSVRRHGRHRARDPRVAGGRRGRRRADRRRRGRPGLLGVLAGAAQAGGACRRCSIPDLFRSKLFRLGITGQMLQQIALGGTMIALPIFLQMVLEYNAMQAGLSHRAALADACSWWRCWPASRPAPAPASIIRAGFALLLVGMAVLIPIVPQRRLRLVPRCPADARRLRARPAGVAAEQLHAVARSPRSGSARQPGVNSAGGSFGLSFGLAFAGAIMLAALSFIVHRPGRRQRRARRRPSRRRSPHALEDDAQVMSNTLLEEQLAGQPEAVQDEILRINTEARPFALQVALLVPLLAALLGVITSLRMMREPDPAPSGAAEGMVLG